MKLFGTDFLIQLFQNTTVFNTKDEGDMINGENLELSNEKTCFIINEILTVEPIVNNKLYILLLVSFKYSLSHR